MCADTYTMGNISKFKINEIMLTGSLTGQKVESVLEMVVPPMGEMPTIKPGDILYSDKNGLAYSVTPSTTDGTNIVHRVMGISCNASENGTKVTVSLTAYIEDKSVTQPVNFTEQAVSGVIYIDAYQDTDPKTLGSDISFDFGPTDPTAKIQLEKKKPEEPDVESPFDRWDFI